MFIQGVIGNIGLTSEQKIVEIEKIIQQYIQEQKEIQDIKKYENQLRKMAVNQIKDSHADWPLLCLAVLAEDLELVRYLIKQDAFINLANPKKETPLLIATRTGNVAIMKELISHGADINCCSVDKITPLHEAVAGSNVASVSFLLEQEPLPILTKETKKNEDAFQLGLRKLDENPTGPIAINQKLILNLLSQTYNRPKRAQWDDVAEKPPASNKFEYFVAILETEIQKYQLLAASRLTLFGAMSRQSEARRESIHCKNIAVEFLRNNPYKTDQERCEKLKLFLNAEKERVNNDHLRNQRNMARLIGTQSHLVKAYETVLDKFNNPEKTLHFRPY